MAQIIENEGHQKGGKKRPKKHSAHIDMTPMVDLMCLLITFFMLTTAFAKPKVMEIVLPEKKKTEDDSPKPQIAKKRTLNVLLTDKSTIYWYIGIYDPNVKDDTIPHFFKTDYSKDGVRKVLLNRNKEVFKKIDELKENVKKGVLKTEAMLEGFKKDSLLAFMKSKVNTEKVTDNIDNLSKDQLVAVCKKSMSENDLINILIQNAIKKIKSEDAAGPIVLIKADKEKTKYKDFVRIIDEMAIANIGRYAVVDLTPNEINKLNELNGVVTVTEEKKK